MVTLMSLLIALKSTWHVLGEASGSCLVAALLFLDCILVLFVCCVFVQQVLLAAAGLTGYEDSKAGKEEDSEHLCKKLSTLRFLVLVSNLASACAPLQIQMIQDDDLQPDLEADAPGESFAAPKEMQKCSSCHDDIEICGGRLAKKLRRSVRSSCRLWESSAGCGAFDPTCCWLQGSCDCCDCCAYSAAATMAATAAAILAAGSVDCTCNMSCTSAVSPAAKDQWQKEDQGPPRVLNLELTQESQLTTQGFPPEAPAIEHDKSMTVFSSAHSILSEVVGDISAEVEIHHDTEWDIFPEIGEAIQRAGGEELCFSVVTCPNHGKWAVGIAAGKKGREVAGKLALAFALLVDREPADLENFCRSYAEFRAVLAEAGLLPPRGGPQKRHMSFPAAGGKGSAPPPFAAPQVQAAPAPVTSPAPFSGGFPQSLWIFLDGSSNMVEEGLQIQLTFEFESSPWDHDMGVVQEGLPAEGFCVYYDKQCAELFRSGQSVLQEADFRAKLHEAVEHPDKGVSYYLLPNKKRTKAKHFWIFRSATLFGLASFMGCKVGKSGK
eukprot:symbB.v1.2.017823.t1/scaffold1324.1/size125322/5